MPEENIQTPSGSLPGVVPGPASKDGSAPSPVPAPVPAPSPARESASKPGEVKDGTREVIETIVFVVVLVLLLKTFLAEAFVIPTGSMADTLLGYHKERKCVQCGFQFLVNASQEAENPGQKFSEVTSGICPNCLYKNEIRPGEP